MLKFLKKLFRSKEDSIILEYYSIRRPPNYVHYESAVHPFPGRAPPSYRQVLKERNEEIQKLLEEIQYFKSRREDARIQFVSADEVYQKLKEQYFQLKQTYPDLLLCRELVKKELYMLRDERDRMKHNFHHRNLDLLRSCARLDFLKRKMKCDSYTARRTFK